MFSLLIGVKLLCLTVSLVRATASPVKVDGEY
jgi:hypothetical protein